MNIKIINSDKAIDKADCQVSKSTNVKIKNVKTTYVL